MQIILLAVLFVSHAVQCEDKVGGESVVGDVGGTVAGGGIVENFGCKTPGFSCSDCETVIMCTDLGHGQWHIDELFKCSNEDNITCFNGACTNKTNPDCAIESFGEDVVALGSRAVIENKDIPVLLSGQGGEELGLGLHVLKSTRRRYEHDSCETAGFTCSGCGLVIMCTATGSNQWQIQEVDTCRREDHVACLNGACSNKTNPDCGIEPEVKFPCGAPGMFPDPFDCQTYHICCKEGERSNVYRCDKDHMYDPTTTYCSKPYYKSSGCPPNLLVPTCARTGQFGQVPGSRSIFYFCVPVHNILYPKMNVCPNGRAFVNGQCIN